MTKRSKLENVHADDSPKQDECPARRLSRRILALPPGRGRNVWPEGGAWGAHSSGEEHGNPYLFRGVVGLVALRRVAPRPAAQGLPANRAVRAGCSAAARGGACRSATSATG